MEIVRDILAIIGGLGLILIGLFKFLGLMGRDFFKERARRNTEFALETKRQQHAPQRVRSEKFAASQYDAYIELWGALQGLKLIIDTLWLNVAWTNLHKLATEFVSAKEKLGKNAIFLRNEHYEKLQELLGTVENYYEGKRRILGARSDKELLLEPQKLKTLKLINNRESKQEFDYLLDDIRDSFQQSLSGVEWL